MSRARQLPLLAFVLLFGAVAFLGGCGLFLPDSVETQNSAPSTEAKT